MFPVLHDDAYWSTLDDISAIRKEDQEMAITHKCDRCGEVTDEICIFIEKVSPIDPFENEREVPHELCEKCAEKVRKWFSDPHIDMVYQSKTFAPKSVDAIREGVESISTGEASKDKLSCYDRWKLTQALQSSSFAEATRCLCDLHK